MQNEKQSYFLQRSLVYTANALVAQVRKGERKYDIKAVYFIALMNKTDPSLGGEFRKDVVLCDKKSKAQFTDLVRLIYLQLPLFDKKEEECDTFFLKWIYVLKNMEVLGELPKGFQCDAFKKLKEVSDVSTLTEQERISYKAAQKAYDDMVGVYEALQDDIEKGYAEGLAEGNRRNAQKMKQKGFSLALINEITGLSIEEIENLN